MTRAEERYAQIAESLLYSSAVPVPLARKLAKQYFARYESRRGSMVVDVVASAWRNYDRVEKHIVPAFEKSVRTPNLKTLAAAIPKIPGLRRGEAAAMQAAAAGLLRFATDRRPSLQGDDEKIVKAWAKYAEPYRFDTKSEPYLGSVKGIGTALFAYMRMRAGADAIKADVWIARKLEEFGAEFEKSTDVVEVTKVAEAVAKAAKLPRLVLDQMLWRGAWKITQAALDELEKTTPWKKFARGYGKVRGRQVRPADIYGPKGMLDGWGISFNTPGDLWEVLARNMGGGMPPEVPKTLVNLCGPRVESLPMKNAVKRGM
jgi:hypothetical protein